MDIHWCAPKVSIFDNAAAIEVCWPNGGASRGKLLGLKESVVMKISMMFNLRPGDVAPMYTAMYLPFDPDMLDKQMEFRKN